jgi:uncharacterized protein with ParB-like and HNH nuclease domain
VGIVLNRSEDNPQLIFGSMNSTGKALSQADLVRNYILMGLQPELQTQLYEDYWRPMELDFGQEAYGDEKAGLISKSILAEIVLLVENYAFRRYVLQIPTNSMNKSFARFSLSIDKNNYLESVKAQFASFTALLSV